MTGRAMRWVGLVGLLMVAPGAAPVNVAESSTTFENTVDGVTYVEFVDPFQRFKWFPISDPDGDGFVTLEPLPYARGLNRLGDVSDLTDAEIGTRLATFGLTKDDVIAYMNTAIGWNPAWDTIRYQANEAITNGRFLQAVNLVTGTSADIVYWCGEEENAIRQGWVVAIPLVMECNSTFPATQIALVTLVPKLITELHPITFLNGPNDVTLEVKALGLSATDGARYVVGASYAGHSYGTLTSTRKAWTVTMDLRHLNSAQPPLTSGQWRVDPSTHLTTTFQESDKLIYTWGSGFTRDRTLSGTLGIAKAEASVTIDIISAKSPTNWVLRFTSAQGADLTVLSGFLDLTNGYVHKYKIGGLPDGVGVSYFRNETPFAGHKHTVNFTNNHPGGQFRPHADLEGTFYADDEEQATVKFTGFPTRAVLLLDSAREGEDKVANVDVSKWSPGNNGLFRTVLVTGHIPHLDLDTTAEFVGRFTLVGSTDYDPLADKQWPFLLQGAYFPQEFSNTRAQHGLGYVAPYDGRTAYAEEGGLSGMGWEARLEESGAVGFLPVGENHLEVLEDPETQEPFGARFWALQRSDQVVTSCLVRYPADGDCA